MVKMEKILKRIRIYGRTTRPEKGCFIRLNAKEGNEDTQEKGRYLSI